MIKSATSDFRQQHFELYEIILPYCTVCTPVDGVIGTWHTPPTCKEVSDAEYSLWLGTDKLPLMVTQPTPSIKGRSILNSQIHRCVTSRSESTAMIKGGGLGSRGTMSITCVDFDGDPGPIEFTDKGSFFGKLKARNVLDGKKIITHYYAITGQQGAEVVRKTGQSIHYITEAAPSGGTFKITAKDALKDLESSSVKFPPPSSITLSGDIDATTTEITLSGTTGLSVGGVFRIEEESFIIKSMSGNSVTVHPRGTTMINPDGRFVFKTDAFEHESGASIQPCYVMSATPLWDVLRDIFKSSGLSEYVQYEQWKTEIGEWSSDAKLYGIMSKPETPSDTLDYLLKLYLIDMWLDQDTQKVKVSATSAWKDASRVFIEGDDYSDKTTRESSSERYSRALVRTRKAFQNRSDDDIEYAKIIEATDKKSETADFYGSPSVKDFEYAPYMSDASAQISMSRFIQRFGSTPHRHNFVMEERKLAGSKLGDIVEIVSRDIQTPSGDTMQARDRAQIVRVQPKLGGIGRQYQIEALSYTALLLPTEPDGELIISLSGDIRDVNLFARAGAPNKKINATFIMESGCTVGSTDVNIPSMRAGGFVAGSRIKIIMRSGSILSGRGGDSSVIETINKKPYTTTVVREAQRGGDAYQSDGIETHIFLSWVAEGAYGRGFGAGGAGSKCALALAAAGFWNQSVAAYSHAIFGGGSGIPGGKGGAWGGVDWDLVSIQPSVATVPPVTAADGDWRWRGNSKFRYNDNQLDMAITKVSVYNFGGGSGTNPALDGIESVATSLVTGPGIDWGPSAMWDTGDQRSNVMPAGGLIKGSNVTVYNSKNNNLFRGNSDPFILKASEAGYVPV